MYNQQLSRREFLRRAAAVGVAFILPDLDQRIEGFRVASAAPQLIVNPNYQKQDFNIPGLAQLRDYAAQQLEEQILRASPNTIFYWNDWVNRARGKKHSVDTEIDKRLAPPGPATKLLEYYDNVQDRGLSVEVIYDTERGEYAKHVKGMKVPLMLSIIEDHYNRNTGRRYIHITDVGSKGKLVHDQSKRVEESDTFYLSPLVASEITTRVKWAGNGSFVIDQYPARGLMHRRASLDAVHGPESYNESGLYTIFRKLGHDSARRITSDAYASVVKQYRELLTETIDRLAKEGKIKVA